MDLRKITTMTDFFVICSGDSDTQVKAIADAVMEGMKAKGIQTWHIEGFMALHWVLLDYVDVVVHIFHKDTRNFYGLERLWGDAKFEYVEDNPAAEEREESAARNRRDIGDKRKKPVGNKKTGTVADPNP